MRTLTQEKIDTKLSIMHDLHELASSALSDYETEGLSGLKFLRKELKRLHRNLKKQNRTGKN